MKPNSIKSTVFIVLVFMVFSCVNNLPTGGTALSDGNKLWQLERPKEKRSGVFTYSVPAGSLVEDPAVAHSKS